MPQNTEYLLIDHLDNLLTGEALHEADELIRNDKNVAKEWQYLLHAVDGIREAGLYEQVSAVKKLYEAKQVDTKPNGAVVRSIYRNAFRVAASLLLIIGAAAIYKYTAVDSGALYNKYYSSFELNTSRGSENQGAMEQAYRAKNWNEVISLFNPPRPRTNKSYFLAGMASMELKKYDKAIDAFNQVIAGNARSGDNYFQDEAEYYLAMSYLANNEAGKAVPMFEKIKSDKNHLYYGKAKEISSIDLTILEYKSHK